MPVPVPLIAAGLSAVSNIGSNIFANRGADKRQDRANQQNVDFWNMQNEYNHPSAQMARLREAGLNPHLVYGGTPSGATGSASPVSPSKAAPYTITNPLQNINEYANLRKTEAQTDNVRANTTVQDQEKILKTMQAATESQRGAKTKVEAELAQELKDVSLDAAKENLRQQQEKTLGLELDNYVKDKTRRTRVQEQLYKMLNAMETLKGNTLLTRLRELEKDNKELGIERHDPLWTRFFLRLYKKFGINPEKFFGP